MYMVSIEDSVKDILLTPLGSRVCLPEYGSRLHELADRRFDDSYRADLSRFVFTAILKWETRIKPKSIKNVQVNDNKLSFILELEDGNLISI